MEEITFSLKNRNVFAWLSMITVLAFHVLDETLNDFLPWYNQTIMGMRERFGFFPAPTFSFEVWLGGLIGAIIIAYILTFVVMKGGKIIRIITTILGILMILNALNHIGGSMYTGRMLPGTWSSPFLLITSVFVVFQGIRGNWQSQKKLNFI
ncbi:HXXEE domain-containing protein [candidate division KSB1 bacterium]